MPRFWDMLKTQEERDYLRSFMPPGWNPDRPFILTETLEEIDRLMREPPRARPTSILAASPNAWKEVKLWDRKPVQEGFAKGS